MPTSLLRRRIRPAGGSTGRCAPWDMPARRGAVGEQRIANRRLGLKKQADLLLLKRLLRVYPPPRSIWYNEVYTDNNQEVSLDRFLAADVLDKPGPVRAWLLELVGAIHATQP